METNYKKNNLSYFMLSLSVIFVVLLQFFIGTPFYPVMRLALYFLLFVTFFVVIGTKLNKFKSKFLSSYLLLIFATVIFVLMISIYKSEIVIGEFVQLLLPFVLLLIGYKSYLTKKQITKIVFLYMLLVTLLGLFIIFYYGNGFSITALYFFSSKNQVGPFIASVIVCSIYLLFNKSKEIRINKFVLMILLVSNVAVLLSLRNRSGLIAISICILVLLISKIKFKKNFSKHSLLAPFPVLALLAILVMTDVLDPIYTMIDKSLFLNYEVNNLNSLSSGRMDTYLQVIDFLQKYPFFGELHQPSFISHVPHNFLLNLWLQYGIFGMLPITVLYLSLWVYVFYKTMITRENDLSLYLILVMLVISLFEYTYPFSPVTTVSFSWILFGVYIKRKELIIIAEKQRGTDLFRNESNCHKAT